MTGAGIGLVEYEPALWPALDAFWTALLGRSWNDDARARWHWLNARRRHFLALDGARVVGNATLLTQPFRAVSGAAFELGWITDFYVLPGMKGHGLGRRLTERLVAEHGPVASFGQSEDARRCFARLGWSAPAWIPLVARVLPMGMAAAKTRLRVEKALIDDPRVGSSSTPSTGAGALVEPAVLRARLSGRPDARYEVLLALDGNDAVGWIAIRLVRGPWNRRFGPIPAGLVLMAAARGDDEETLDALIRTAARNLGRAGALAVLATSTRGPLGKALQRAGFETTLRLGPARLKALPAKGFTFAPSAASQLTAGIPLTFLDCDAELTF